MATNLNDIKISIAGKCSHCGHALHETFVAQGKHQNVEQIEQRIVPATPDSVLRAVCEATGIAPGDITGRRGQHMELALARQMYTWLLREHLNLSWRTVAETVGYADHTSAMHATLVLSDYQWPGDMEKPWFSDKGDGVLWLHVDNLVNDLKVAYGAILRSKVKVKK